MAGNDQLTRLWTQSLVCWRWTFMCWIFVGAYLWIHLVKHKLMTFPWLLSIITFRHTHCPFIPSPPFCLIPYQLSERERKKVGGYLYWVAPPLSSGHWEWVNTKPPLLTSTLVHPDTGRQGDSYRRSLSASKRVNGQTESEFKTSVNVQSECKLKHICIFLACSSTSAFLCLGYRYSVNVDPQLCFCLCDGLWTETHLV